MVQILDMRKHVLPKVPRAPSCVMRDLFRNFHRQLQRGGGLKSRNLWLSSGGGAFDECSELLLERFLAFDLDFVAANPAADFPVNLAALILVIEGEICVLLEHADLAH